LEAVHASTESPQRESGHIAGLDGIRAIAFLLVFWAHATPAVSYYIPATLGVTIFFFLSGYLITTLLRREWQSTGTVSLRNFYIRRTLRIFAPLYVVFALTAAFAHIVMHWPMGNRIGILSLLFYFYNYAVILHWDPWLPLGMNVVWSLAVEEHFYLLFPLAYLAMMRRGLSRLTQSRILIGFCVAELVWRFALIAVIHEHREWTYYATDARLDSILWGCLLAMVNNPVFGDRPLLARKHQIVGFAAALLLLIASLIPRSIVYRESLRYTLQAMALYVIFGFVVANARHASVAWLEWLPLRYLGWISYVLYLSHDFILNVVSARYPGHPQLLGPLAFVIALAFATAMRYVLELPLQRLRARFRRLPDAAAPVATRTASSGALEP
jgi:peptidoglycan/LPS O-acetylase OafA/YrhL